jgi:hypothetical protein
MKLKVPKRMLRETLAMAVDSVRSHKFRSFLTVLGIVIGVMTAICIAVASYRPAPEYCLDDRGVWNQ